MKEKTKARLKTGAKVIGVGGGIMACYTFGRMNEAGKILRTIDSSIRTSCETGEVVLDKIATFEFVMLCNKK